MSEPSEEAVAPTAPTDVDEVVATLQGTVLEVWKGFLEHLPFLVVGVVVLLLTWGATRVAQAIAERALSRTKLRGSLRELVERFISIAVWILGVTLAAMVIFPGLTPTKALGAAGIVSIAVGFAFQDIFENFFAGVLLLWRFPFEKGDFVECQGIVGKVEEVTIRMTRIERPTGELVVIPNSVLFKNPVDVLTRHDARRVTIAAGVAYDVDVPEAVEVIERAVRECETVRDDAPVEIYPSGFGASSIDIDVTWWTDPTPGDIRRSKGEVVTAVKGALDAAGIEIPFPYRTLTFKEPLPIDARDASRKPDAPDSIGE